MGIHISPLHCRLIRQGMENIKERIEKSSIRTCNILTLMKKYKEIDCVKFPFSLIAGPLINQSSKSLIPSVIWFHVTSNNNNLKVKCREWMKDRVENILKIDYATSYAKAKDTIDPWPKRDSTGIWIRLSIGYQEDETFVKRFDEFITSLQ